MIRGVFSPRFNEENLAANAILADRVRSLADTFNCTPAQLCLAWVLAQWEGVLPIPGTKKRKYLEDNIGSRQRAVYRAGSG